MRIHLVFFESRDQIIKRLAAAGRMPQSSAVTPQTPGAATSAGPRIIHATSHATPRATASPVPCRLPHRQGHRRSGRTRIRCGSGASAALEERTSQRESSRSASRPDACTRPAPRSSVGRWSGVRYTSGAPANEPATVSTIALKPTPPHPGPAEQPCPQGHAGTPQS